MSEISTGSGSVLSMDSERETLRRKAVVAKEAVADLASEAGRFAAHRVSDLKGQAVEWAGTAKEKARDVNASVVTFVQENPYKSLTIAAGVGFVIGYLLRRR